ncbi:hypothetical protein QR685DRAFT_429535, partial [Neurospora intermedia]
YYNNYSIIVFSLPPYFIYFFQPFNIVVFQLFKYYYPKALDIIICNSYTKIIKLNFLLVI